MFIIILQKIFWETLVQTLYFPIWWYSGGIKYAALGCVKLFRAGNTQLAPALWFRNIFVPMYGQYDIQGRIISFLMRLFQIIVRTIATLFWLVICLIIFCAWLALPIVISWGLYSSVA